MIYKIINGLCPDNLKGRLATRSQISNYSTRNYLDLDIPRQNLEFSKKSFLLWCKDVERNPITNKNEFHDYHVQKEIKGIPAKLASFPEA